MWGWEHWTASDTRYLLELGHIGFSIEWVDSTAVFQLSAIWLRYEIELQAQKKSRIC
jgi:hypothetical protein